MGRGGLVVLLTVCARRGEVGPAVSPFLHHCDIHHRTSMYTTVSPSCQFASRTESVTRYL